MAEWGLTTEDAATDQVELWAENILTKDVFVAMGTQWRPGFAGPTGLDYAVLPFVMRAIGVPRANWQDVFDGIRAMEGAALDVIHDK